MSRRPAGSKRHRERGISLIETLIAMALGLLVLTGVLQLMSQLIDGNTHTLKVARLEQDVRTVIDVIVQDLRRAGSFPESVRDLGDAKAFLQDQPPPPLIDGEVLRPGQSGSSVTYAYRDSDGKLTQGKFAWDSKAGTVQMHTGTAAAPETITDPAFMNVSTLSFVPVMNLQQSGALQAEAVLIEVRLAARLKSDTSVERQLVDRVVLKNVVLQ